MERATDIYATVMRMRQATLDELATDDVLFGDAASYLRKEVEAQTLQRVLHVLEDEFGVTRPAPSLTAHLEPRS